MPAVRSSSLGAVWLAVVLFAGSGATCIQTINRPPLPAGATLEQAVEVVERQTAWLGSIQASSARISGTADGQTIPQLSAKIAAAPPRNLRLIGETIFTGKEVDLGSNPEIFWFWVRRNQPPAILYCRHEQFAQAPIRQAIPIDPAWVLETIGFGVFHYGDQHQNLQPLGRGRLAIRTFRPTAEGTQTKFTVVDERMGWVLEQQLYNARGQREAIALLADHVKDPITGSVVARKLDLQWPLANITLKIDLGDVSFNELDATGTSVWQMPEIPGFPQVNLAELGPDGPR